MITAPKQLKGMAVLQKFMSVKVLRRCSSMQEEYAERISEPVNRLITENITTALVNAGHITHPDIA